MFIRTLKNSFNLDIVIDTTTDVGLVENTAFDWIEVAGPVQKGDYYYNGQIYSEGQPGFEVIQSIITSFNETNLRQYEEEVAAAAVEIVIEDHVPPPIPAPPVLPAPVDYTEDPGYLPPDLGTPPVVKEFTREEIPSTQENLDIQQAGVPNTQTLLTRLKSGTGLVKSNHRVDFNPPLEYNDGATQTKVFYPEATFEEYVAYIEGNLNSRLQLIQRIKTDLGL